MKVKDVIAKQEEYKKIQQARMELGLFREKTYAFYMENKALYRNDTTSRLFEREILDKVKVCEDELKKQLEEMEV